MGCFRFGITCGFDLNGPLDSTDFPDEPFGPYPPPKPASASLDRSCRPQEPIRRRTDAAHTRAAEFLQFF